MSNRSKIKYAPFDSLVGYRDMVNNTNESRNKKIEKPYFSEDELAYFNELIVDSLNNKKEILITYMSKEKLLVTKAYVKNVIYNNLYLSTREIIGIDKLFSITKETI